MFEPPEFPDGTRFYDVEFRPVAELPVQRQDGGVFTFKPTGHPDSRWGRTNDDFLDPLRPDPDEDAAELFAPADGTRAARERG